jgi:catechol 2,3-dioxygenase-like lactoylglutathione lyase family enzyme
MERGLYIDSENDKDAMKINHLVVGSSSVEKSVAFYCDLFGFEKVPDDPGRKGGQVLQGRECDLLILPDPTSN